MRKLFFIFLFFLILVLLVGALVIAQEEAAKYNFGSAQAAKTLSVKPGNEVETKLYFYNLYGNRPTHIKLEVLEKPNNWEVSLNPDVSDKKYEVAGIETTVQENLVVYPSNASEQPGTNTDSKEWISSKVGYINADFVIIKIFVPENEQIGKTGKINITADAFWLGQSGGNALQQEREFEYSVTTTTEYYEKPVEPEPELEEEASEQELGKETRGGITGLQLTSVQMLMTGVTLTLVVVFVVLLILAGRRKAKKAEKEEKKEKK